MSDSNESLVFSSRSVEEDMSDEGSGVVDNCEDEEFRATEKEDNFFQTEDSIKEPELPEELEDVEVKRKEKQQAGEKENRKGDKKEETSPKGSLMWKGDRLFPPVRKSLKPSKAWEFGGFKKDQAG